MPSPRFTPGRRHFVALLGVVVASFACDDQTPTAPSSDTAEHPSLTAVTTGALLTAEDSAAYQASSSTTILSGTLEPASQSAMVLEQPGGFVIERLPPECAAQGNTVTLTAPVERVITSNGCHPEAWGPVEIEGPFPAGTAIAFSFHSGFTGRAGSQRVSGSFPEWVVSFEDGWDSDYNDVVIRVRYVPVASTLMLELTPSSASVLPVLDRTFDARAQTWQDAATPARLYDVVDLGVRAYWSPSGRPAEDATVRLHVRPVEESGGHPHGPRPSGSFFTTEDRPTAANQRKGVVAEEITVTTSAEGTATAVYRSSGVSGLEIVHASVEAEGETAEAETTVTVAFPGLQEVPRAGDHYVFEAALPGGTNSHHPVENYLAAGVLPLMETLWRDYMAHHRTDPVGFPLSRDRFVVTGASILGGGLYDVHRNWRTPDHRTHRTGRDIDFDDPQVEQAHETLAQFCARPKYVFEQVATTCQLHTHHIHVFVGDTHYH